MLIMLIVFWLGVFFFCSWQEIKNNSQNEYLGDHVKEVLQTGLEPCQVAPAKALLTYQTPVAAIKHALRQSARALGTSVSDPEHIRKKLPPTEDCKALMAAGRIWVIFKLEIPEAEFHLDLKSGYVKKQAGSGFEIQTWDPLSPKWHASTASRTKLYVSV